MSFESEYCREVTWKEIAQRVKKVNPDLFAIIEEINPDDDLTFYLAKYPYGAGILQNGNFHLPNKHGNTVSIDSDEIPKKIKNDLGYAGTVPLSLLLSHSAELLIHPEPTRIVPFSIYTTGKIFGLWKVLGKEFSYVSIKIWSIFSGGRSVFMLPKITDNQLHEKLCREYKFKSPPPKQLLDHWHVFREISDNSSTSKNWHTEILFFSYAWIKKRDKLLSLYYYLYEAAWMGSEYWRNKIIFDSIWDSFVKELSKVNVKRQGYIIDIVKHIITMGLGILPSFRPALDDELLPLKSIQTAYTDVYGLKKFYPTIIVPHHFQLTDKRPAYWSFQLDNYFETVPRPSAEATILKDMENTLWTLDKFCSSIIKSSNDYISNTKYEDFIKSVDYTFIHSESALNSKSNKRTDVLSEEDRSFFNEGYSFPEQAAFIRACVRLKNVESPKDQ